MSDISNTLYMLHRVKMFCKLLCTRYTAAQETLSVAPNWEQLKHKWQVNYNMRLTKLLQGRNPKLLVMIIRKRSGAGAHDFCCDGLGGSLHRLHPADEGLEALVGEWRLATIELDDPDRVKKEGENRRWSAWKKTNWYSSLITFHYSNVIVMVVTDGWQGTYLSRS